MKRLRFLVPSLALALTAVVACSDDTPTGPPGGPVQGTADSHCGITKNTWTQAVCQNPPKDGGVSDAAALDAAADATVDAGISDSSSDAQKHEVDGAPHDEDAGAGGDYGETLYNASGADDDCKFDFAWSSTPIYKDTDVTFTVDITSRFDGAKPVAADPYPEVFLDATHPAPNSGTKSKDLGNGRYSVGPVRFDRAGRWTVRFHVYENCIDSEESPHCHVAFYVDVP
ncbi:hypothetical protein BH09MYX1_BH09MYX1_31670 [soil metagenome]